MKCVPALAWMNVVTGTLQGQLYTHRNHPFPSWPSTRTLLIQGLCMCLHSGFLSIKSSGLTLGSPPATGLCPSPHLQDLASQPISCTVCPAMGLPAPGG